MNSEGPIIYQRKDHGISRRSIDPDALAVMSRLSRSGYRAYLVGGGVRDLLLGKKPKDFDIATDATPRKIKALFRNSRIIGRRFKLAHVFFHGGKILEVATFRGASDAIGIEDEQNDHPETLANDNLFGTEASDAYRRDITINALFYNPVDFTVIDYVGGMKDIQDGVVRVIGNPDQRFREDPVRMTRVLRHAARTGFKIESQAWESLRRNRELIRVCPPMRIYEEIKKDFQSAYLGPVLQLMAQSEILELIIPELLHNFPAISNASSSISKAIKRIDEMNRKGQTVSPSVVLSVMLAFLDDNSFKSGVVSEALRQNEQQKALITSTFKLLQITKRDREQIQIIFQYWQLLTEGSKLKNLFRSPDDFQRLSAFLKIIDSPLKENLEVLAREKPLQETEESVEPPRRPRRRSRKPQQAFNKQG